MRLFRYGDNLSNKCQKFFPDIVPFSGWRMRATKELNAIGSIYTGIANGSIPTPDGSKAQISLPWDAASVLNANGTAYTKWEQMFGPLVDHSDNFTNTVGRQAGSAKVIKLIYYIGTL